MIFLGTLQKSTSSRNSPLSWGYESKLMSHRLWLIILDHRLWFWLSTSIRKKLPEKPLWQWCGLHVTFLWWHQDMFEGTKLSETCGEVVRVQGQSSLAGTPWADSVRWLKVILRFSFNCNDTGCRWNDFRWIWRDARLVITVWQTESVLFDLLIKISLLIPKEVLVLEINSFKNSRLTPFNEMIAHSTTISLIINYNF